MTDILLWTSIHRNWQPSVDGPDGDNSWTTFFHRIIPGGVGENERMVAYWRTWQEGDPTEWTLPSENTTSNPSSSGIITRFRNAETLDWSDSATDLDVSTPSISIEPGGVAYFGWVTALGGDPGPTPDGLIEIAKVTHSSGADIQTAYKVMASGGMSGSYTVSEMASSHDGSFTIGFLFSTPTNDIDIHAAGTGSTTVPLTLSIPPEPTGSDAGAPWRAIRVRQASNESITQQAGAKARVYAGGNTYL